MNVLTASANIITVGVLVIIALLGILSVVGTVGGLVGALLATTYNVLLGGSFEVLRFALIGSIIAVLTVWVGVNNYE